MIKLKINNQIMSHRFSKAFNSRINYQDYSNSTRRHSTMNVSSPPAERSFIKPKSQRPSLPLLQDSRTKKLSFRELNQMNSLQQYQNWLNKKNLELIQLRSKPVRKITRRLPTEGIRINTEVLNSLASEVRQMKRELQLENQSKTAVQTRILSELILSERRREHIVQPINTPYIMPIYIPYQQPNYSENRERPKSRRNYTQPTVRTSFRRKLESTKKRVTARWKKLANCTLFIIYLKRFCRLARESRKQAFNQFYMSVEKKISNVKQIISKGTYEFTKTILSKPNASFNISRDDSYEEMEQKINYARNLVKTLLFGITEQVKENEDNPELLQSFYYLCKHGNYSCSQPLLTKDELQLSCISQSFQYISADCNLQKTALINLLLIKLLVYNTLLDRQMVQYKDQNEVPANLYLLASILYELFVDVENRFMEGVPVSYKIGNYRHQFYEVKGLKSMIVNKAKYEQGKLISGLIDSQVIINSFRLSGWKKEKKAVQDLVQFGYKMIQRYHKKVTDKLK